MRTKSRGNFIWLSWTPAHSPVIHILKLSSPHPLQPIPWSCHVTTHSIVCSCWNPHLALPLTYKKCENEKEEEPSLSLHVWGRLHLFQEKNQRKGVTLRCVYKGDQNTVKRGYICLDCQCLFTKWIWLQTESCIKIVIIFHVFRTMYYY